MTHHRHGIVLAAAMILVVAQARAQAEGGRAAVLDRLGQGTAAFRAGDMIGATQQWSEAIRAAHAIADDNLEAQALMRRGEANRVTGHINDADRDLRAALVKAEASGDEALLAAGSGALGSLEFLTQHADAAEPLLTRSRDLARRLGDRAILASSDNDLGNLYLGRGRLGDAARAYAEAIASADAARDDVLAGTAEINSARLALRQNDAAAAIATLARAVERLQRAPPTYSGSLALVTAGSLAFEREGAIPADFRNTANHAFRAAEANAEKLRNPTLLSLAKGGLGRLDERTGRIGEAASLTDRALFAAQEASAPELSFRWDWQQARLSRRQGQDDAALASYRRAVAGLQSVRRDIPVQYQDGRSSYRVTFGPLYLEYSDLLLRRAAVDPAHAAALRIEARDTIERLKESELQDYFRDSCVADFKARQQSIETIAPGAAVLYPISLPDRIELLVSFGQEQQQFTIPVAEAALQGEVRQFRELLEKRTTNEYLVPARQLYDQIIRPIEPALAAHHVDTLVIVPDTVLRVIPFAALHDGKNFLIEHYATAIAPSMKLIDPKPLAAGERNALVLGIGQSVQGFVDLPNVPKEMDAVHGIEGGKELINAAFSEARFASEMKLVPNIVHIASHGQFSTDPKHTFVLAYDGELTMDDLEADIKFGEHRSSALELLVLSACETASGDDRAALGLAGVALKAGARSAVASLWYVSDQASGDLVVDFYRDLQSGLSKAQALRAAQRHLASTQRYAHPAYWAPFLLIGNWL